MEGGRSRIETILLQSCSCKSLQLKSKKLLIPQCRKGAELLVMACRTKTCGGCAQWIHSEPHPQCVSSLLRLYHSLQHIAWGCTLCNPLKGENVSTMANAQPNLPANTVLVNPFKATKSNSEAGEKAVWPPKVDTLCSHCKRAMVKTLDSAHYRPKEKLPATTCTLP